MTSAIAPDNNKDNAKRIENEAADIAATIKDTEKFVSAFLLTALRSILNEQQGANALDKETADYIYLAVKDQAIRKGWLNSK